MSLSDTKAENCAVAFIGLGTMGAPMAGHLARAGYSVTVFNRTSSKADAWVSGHGGAKASSPAAAAEGTAFVISCVGDDDDLRDVTVGRDGAFEAMGADTLYIDHSTVSANVARELSDRAEELGVGFLDAPVSGGQAGAEDGTLSIMVGGDEAAFDRAMPLLKAYGEKVAWIGPSGSGQLAKMVNQICIAGLIQSLSEGLDFGLRAGLQMDRVLDVIGKGAAGSWQMEHRARTMLRGEFDFGFAVDWMRKDLGICLDESARNGALLETARQVDGFYREIQEKGGGRWDTSSLIARLRRPEGFD